MALPMLRVIRHPLAIAKFSRLDKVSEISGSFVSLTCTPDEVSLVCEVSALPAGALEVHAPWRGLAVVGPLDFALTGILAPIAVVLAEAQISIFAISSYDTDFVLVREEMLAAAIAALTEAGYRIVE